MGNLEKDNYNERLFRARHLYAVDHSEPNGDIALRFKCEIGHSFELAFKWHKGIVYVEANKSIE